jgi:hypothetical protein
VAWPEAQSGSCLTAGCSPGQSARLACSTKLLRGTLRLLYHSSSSAVSPASDAQAVHCYFPLFVPVTEPSAVCEQPSACAHGTERLCLLLFAARLPVHMQL